MKDDDEPDHREEHLNLLIPSFLSAFGSYSTVLTSDDRILFLVFRAESASHRGLGVDISRVRCALEDN